LKRRRPNRVEEPIEVKVTVYRRLTSSSSTRLGRMFSSQPRTYSHCRPLRERNQELCRDHPDVEIPEVRLMNLDERADLRTSSFFAPHPAAKIRPSSPPPCPPLRSGRGAPDSSRDLGRSPLLAAQRPPETALLRGSDGCRRCPQFRSCDIERLGVQRPHLASPLHLNAVAPHCQQYCARARSRR
jgi:hypothetical protein